MTFKRYLRFRVDAVVVFNSYTAIPALQLVAKWAAKLKTLTFLKIADRHWDVHGLSLLHFLISCTSIVHMADLSMLPDESFDLVFNPCSNCFAPDVRAIWRESARVLRHGGILLTGFNNPVLYSVDQKLEADGIVQLVHTIPYSDLTSLSPEDLKAQIARGDLLEFGHTLADQIGGQLDAGLVMTAMFEDNWGESHGVVDRLMDMFIATRAIKP